MHAVAKGVLQTIGSPKTLKSGTHAVTNEDAESALESPKRKTLIPNAGNPGRSIAVAKEAVVCASKTLSPKPYPRTQTLIFPQVHAVAKEAVERTPKTLSLKSLNLNPAPSTETLLKP